MSEYYAARLHNSWRRELLKSKPQQRGRPRMRLRGGTLVDVNQPWDKLHPKAKEDNRLAAYAAYEAVRRYPDDREAAAGYVHRAWIKRNRADKTQPKALFKPYAQLPEVEKDKDRAHVDSMKKAITMVQKRLRKPAGRKSATAKRPRARSAPAPTGLKFNARDLRRIEAAGKKLAHLLGRPVPVEAAVMAGVEAVATLCDALAAAPKSRRR